MSSGGGSSPLSPLTDLILTANAGNSSFVVNTDETPSLYIDNDAKVGINTLTPASQLEVNSETGACITVRNNGSESAYGSINISETGNVAINTNGSKVSTNKSFNIENHNGSTVGLELAGTVVQATAEELNYVAGVSAGSVSAGKAIVVDETKALSGLSSVSATSLSGTLQTAAQPNITSVGTLTSLNVAGTFSATQLGGTLQTAAQPNITSVGTLSSLSVTGGVSAAQLSGTLQTAAQPNITSLGNLSSLTVNGVNVGSELGYVSDVTAGSASASKAVVLDSNKSVSGITSISSTNLSGTLQTATQPNITSVGTLTSLNVAGGISASTLSGTVLTAAQPNITSVGNLSSVRIAGSLIGSEASFLSGVNAGEAAASKALVLSSGKSISGITSLSATQLSGTLSAGPQPNITAVGNLSSVNVAGFTIGSEAAFLSGAVAGTAANSKALVLNGSGAISGISSLSATSLSGTLQTAAQPNITSVGTLGSLTVSGSTYVSSATDSVNKNTGALRVAGGMSVVKNMFVGGVIDAAGFTINGSPIGTSSSSSSSGGSSSGGSVSLPSYITDITAGTATESKALVLDSSKNISGVNRLSASSITLGSTSLTSTEVDYISDITAGTAAASKALVLDSSKNVSGINNLKADSIYGNIESTTGLSTIWSYIALPFIHGWKSVCWAPQLNLFVGVASSGTSSRIMTSTNGKVWNYISGNTSSVLYSVCWSPELSLFVAAGSNGTSAVLTSPDGNTWTPRTTPSVTWKCVCWSPELSLFVALSNSSSIITSPNGITWTSRTAAANLAWQSICWSPQLNMFVAVANTGTGNRVMTSSDGITWTTRTSAADSPWVSVCWSQQLNRFVVLSTSGTYRIMWSYDGITWVAAGQGLNLGNGLSIIWIAEIGKFIATASGTFDIGVSADGITWDLYTSGGTGTWGCICWSPQLKYIIALSDATTTLTSTVLISYGEYSSITMNSPLQIQSLQNSTSINNGALNVAGGVGICKNITIGGKAIVNNTTSAGGGTDGALIVEGGILAKGYCRFKQSTNGCAQFDGAVYMSNSDSTTGIGNGCLQVNGGASIQKELWLGGAVKSYTSASTIQASASLYVLGKTMNASTAGVDNTHRTQCLINAPTLSSDSTSIIATTTNASTLYISGSPIQTASRNTIINAYALYINGGTSYFGGDILYTGTSSQTSDYRLKQNVSNLYYGIDTIKALRPVEYNLVESPTKQTLGFIAHEVQNIIPEVVSGNKDDMNPDDTPKYQSVNYIGFIPVLVKAIQELDQKLSDALTRIQQLESKL